MTQASTGPGDGLAPQNSRDAREWVRILAGYRDPSTTRSLFELLATVVPFLALGALAWWSLTVGWLLCAVISALNGAFLVRLFILQHDCSHNSMFRSRQLNEWLGRVLGVLTLTPFDVWRRTHSIHHSAAGNLDRRGIGDVPTLTVEEYGQLTPFRRFLYRLYRNPVFLFGVAPFYLFFLQNRLPIGLMRAGWRYWLSAMATNSAIAVLLGVGVYFGGLAVLLVYVPSALIGGSAGMWLFYVQHQFEQTEWDRETDWQIHDAALHGSSHYVLPPVLRWFSANVGIHHVHHLYSRIPFYRLAEVLRDHPVLANAQRLTLRESLHCARLHLWHEGRRKLLSFADARALAFPG